MGRQSAVMIEMGLDDLVKTASAAIFPDSSFEPTSTTVLECC